MILFLEPIDNFLVIFHFLGTDAESACFDDQFCFEEFRHRVRSREVLGFVRDGVVAFLEKVFTALLDVCHLWNIFVCMEVME